MIAKQFIAAVGVIGLACASSAAQVIASDSAEDIEYAFGWLEFSNGGVGYGPWQFATLSENTDGFAGAFLASEPNDGLSNIGNPSGFAWALFANSGTGLEQSAAFRPISNPIAAGDVTFSMAYEHGFIADGGLVGFSLRNGNANLNAGDYGVGSRFQFFFQGGNGNYVVVDGDGVLDTGIPFTLDGVVVSLDFTSADTYSLRVTRFGDELGSSLSYAFPERNLAGAGAVESIALFNDDGGSVDASLNNDVFFNNMVIENTVPPNIELDVDGNGVLNYFDVLKFLEFFDAAL